MAKMILGIINNKDNAEGAINTLVDLGYNPKDMSVIMKDSVEAEDLSHTTGTTVTDGAVSGATTGGLIGGLAGLLIGVGAITIPGIGALLIGGPLAAALGLSGALATTVSGAVTGALTGGLVGALVSLGIPEEDAHIYESHVRDGAILIAVPTVTGREDEVRDVLLDYGVSQIREINTARASAHPFSEETDYGDTFVGAAGGAVGEDEEGFDFKSSRIRSRRRRI